MSQHTKLPLPQIPAGFAERVRLRALQAALEVKPQLRTKEQYREIEQLQKAAYRQRPRHLRRKLARELRFA